MRLSEVSPASEREGLLKQAEEVLERYAQNGGVPLMRIYNHACLLALRGRRSEALASLEECLATGEISVDHVRKDSDWAGFRGDPEFEALLARSDR